MKTYYKAYRAISYASKRATVCGHHHQTAASAAQCQFRQEANEIGNAWGVRKVQDGRFKVLTGNEYRAATDAYDTERACYYIQSGGW